MHGHPNIKCLCLFYNFIIFSFIFFYLSFIILIFLIYFIIWEQLPGTLWATPGL